MDLFGSDSESDSEALPAPPSLLTLLPPLLALRSTHNRLYPAHPFILGHEAAFPPAIIALLTDKGLTLTPVTPTLPSLTMPSPTMPYYDALLLTIQPPSTPKYLAPHGALCVFTEESSDTYTLAVTVPPILPNTTTALWKGSSPKTLALESDLIAKVTVRRPAAAMSVSGLGAGSMCDRVIADAIDVLTTYGLCIFPKFLPDEVVESVTEPVFRDFEAAKELLKSLHGIDLVNPTVPLTDNYHELSSREDYRVDMRNGPAMKAFYKTALHAELTTIPSVLEIVKNVFMPRSQSDKTLHLGNYGLYNFAGTGPETTPDPHIGRFGSVISLPGAVDQALHADTSHLFNNVQCPAHYINLFLPGVTEPDTVGWTAFVPKSHELAFCRDVMEDERKKMLYENLIRPRLEKGDCVLFDCRVLHFGTGNTEEGVVRPLHYVNYFKEGFRDTKNWDDREKIFKD